MNDHPVEIAPRIRLDPHRTSTDILNRWRTEMTRWPWVGPSRKPDAGQRTNSPRSVCRAACEAPRQIAYARKVTSFRAHLPSFVAVAASTALAGCFGIIAGPVSESADTGARPPEDIGVSPIADTGVSRPEDAGLLPVDSGLETPDTGAMTVADAGGGMGPPVVEVLDADVTRPWAIEFLPDGRALVTERGGRLRILGTDDQLSGPVQGVPNVYAAGQGGLLDVLRSRSFTTDGTIFLCYSAQEGNASGTEVARARLEGLQLQNLQVIFRVDPKTASGSNHYGCRLAFDGTGALMIGVGDRFGQMDQAQVLSNHLGKIMRINPDGSVPADNPYVGDGQARDEIWSYGHRNIQGMATHPVTGDVWNIEHGPAGGDEVNRPRPRANHGWPLACYGSHYDGTDIPDDHAGRAFAEPIYYWTPSIAPSGMHIYNGDLFPEWRGHIFVGALRGARLVRLEMDGDRVVSETNLLRGRGWRIRDVTESPDGRIYVVTDANAGRIVRITR